MQWILWIAFATVNFGDILCNTSEKSVTSNVKIENGNEQTVEQKHVKRDLSYFGAAPQLSYLSSMFNKPYEHEIPPFWNRFMPPTTPILSPALVPALTRAMQDINPMAAVDLLPPSSRQLLSQILANMNYESFRPYHDNILQMCCHLPLLNSDSSILPLIAMKSKYYDSALNKFSDDVLLREASKFTNALSNSNICSKIYQDSLCSQIFGAACPKKAHIAKKSFKPSYDNYHYHENDRKHKKHTHITNPYSKTQRRPFTMLKSTDNEKRSTKFDLHAKPTYFFKEPETKMNGFLESAHKLSQLFSENKFKELRKYNEEAQQILDKSRSSGEKQEGNNIKDETEEVDNSSIDDNKASESETDIQTKSIEVKKLPEPSQQKAQANKVSDTNNNKKQFIQSETILESKKDNGAENRRNINLSSVKKSDKMILDQDVANSEVISKTDVRETQEEKPPQTVVQPTIVEQNEPLKVSNPAKNQRSLAKSDDLKISNTENPNGAAGRSQHSISNKDYASSNIVRKPKEDDIISFRNKSAQTLTEENSTVSTQSIVTQPNTKPVTILKEESQTINNKNTGQIQSSVPQVNGPPSLPTQVNFDAKFSQIIKPTEDKAPELLPAAVLPRSKEIDISENWETDSTNQKQSENDRSDEETPELLPTSKKRLETANQASELEALQEKAIPNSPKGINANEPDAEVIDSLLPNKPNNGANMKLMQLPGEDIESNEVDSKREDSDEAFSELNESFAKYLPFENTEKFKYRVYDDGPPQKINYEPLTKDFTNKKFKTPLKTNDDVGPPKVHQPITVHNHHTVVSILPKDQPINSEKLEKLVDHVNEKMKKQNSSFDESSKSKIKQNARPEVSERLLNLILEMLDLDEERDNKKSSRINQKTENQKTAASEKITAIAKPDSPKRELNANEIPPPINNKTTEVLSKKNLEDIELQESASDVVNVIASPPQMPSYDNNRYEENGAVYVNPSTQPNKKVSVDSLPALISFPGVALYFNKMVVDEKPPVLGLSMHLNKHEIRNLPCGEQLSHAQIVGNSMRNSQNIVSQEVQKIQEAQPTEPTPYDGQKEIQPTQIQYDYNTKPELMVYSNPKNYQNYNTMPNQPVNYEHSKIISMNSHPDHHQQQPMLIKLSSTPLPPTEQNPQDYAPEKLNTDNHSEQMSQKGQEDERERRFYNDNIHQASDYHHNNHYELHDMETSEKKISPQYVQVELPILQYEKQEGSKMYIGNPTPSPEVEKQQYVEQIPQNHPGYSPHKHHAMNIQQQFDRDNHATALRDSSHLSAIVQSPRVQESEVYHSDILPSTEKEEYFNPRDKLKMLLQAFLRRRLQNPALRLHHQTTNDLEMSASDSHSTTNQDHSEIHEDKLKNSYESTVGNPSNPFVSKLVKVFTKPFDSSKMEHHSYSLKKESNNHNTINTLNLKTVHNIAKLLNHQPSSSLTSGFAKSTLLTSPPVFNNIKHNNMPEYAKTELKTKQNILTDQHVDAATPTVATTKNVGGNQENFNPSENKQSKSIELGEKQTLLSSDDDDEEDCNCKVDSSQAPTKKRNYEESKARTFTKLDDIKDELLNQSNHRQSTKEMKLYRKVSEALKLFLDDKDQNAVPRELVAEFYMFLNDLIDDKVKDNVLQKRMDESVPPKTSFELITTTKEPPNLKKLNPMMPGFSEKHDRHKREINENLNRQSTPFSKNFFFDDSSLFVRPANIRNNYNDNEYENNMQARDDLWRKTLQTEPDIARIVYNIATNPDRNRESMNKAIFNKQQNREENKKNEFTDILDEMIKIKEKHSKDTNEKNKKNALDLSELQIQALRDKRFFTESQTRLNGIDQSDEIEVPEHIRKVTYRVNSEPLLMAEDEPRSSNSNSLNFDSKACSSELHQYQTNSRQISYERPIISHVNYTPELDNLRKPAYFKSTSYVPGNPDHRDAKFLSDLEKSFDNHDNYEPNESNYLVIRSQDYKRPQQLPDSLANAFGIEKPSHENSNRYIRRPPSYKWFEEYNTPPTPRPKQLLEHKNHISNRRRRRSINQRNYNKNIREIPASNSFQNENKSVNQKTLNRFWRNFLAGCKRNYTLKNDLQVSASTTVDKSISLNSKPKKIRPSIHKKRNIKEYVETKVLNIEPIIGHENAHLIRGYDDIGSNESKNVIRSSSKEHSTESDDDERESISNSTNDSSYEE